MATISIPLLFQDVTGDARRAEVEGATLREVISALDVLYPGIKSRICDSGKLKPIVALTVDGRIATLGLATPVGPNSQVSILPSFGGG